MDYETKKQEVIKEIKSILYTDSTGHDFYHVERVALVARQIALAENGDPQICEIAGWVHDMCRPIEKETGKRHWEAEALAIIEALLLRAGFSGAFITAVLTCVEEHENYGFLDHTLPGSLESAILQDADRLDAIGAIGIARTFMFAGAHGHALYVPDSQRKGWSPEQQSGTAIDHFYEKLFLIADGMNTKTAKRIAAERKNFMEAFLQQFMNEWEGEKDAG